MVVLIVVFPVILQTVNNVITLSTGGQAANRTNETLQFYPVWYDYLI